MEEDWQPKILIVDDEIDICEMMMFTFESKGFEAFTANDAEEAFEVVLREDLDVVVSDVRMPKGGGMKLLSDIKAHNPIKPRVFLITGYSDGSREEAMAAGAETVLSKPIKLGELVEVVTKAITT